LPPLDAKTAPGQPFIELTEVDSTNIYAMGQVQANLAGHGACFFAHHQSGGKGRQGKQWLAEAGTHIAMTVVLDCSFLAPTRQFPVSMMAALATHDLFSRYAGDETRIKWPNDIYWRDRKAGGILIENLIRGSNWQWSLVGIGLNINQAKFPESLPNAVSLKQVTGKDFDPVVLAKELCDCLDQRYTQVKEARFSELLDEYNSYLFKRNETVRLRKNNTGFNCSIRGVSASGELQVLGGSQESFRFDEVEWVLPAAG
jgi:BirA family biotin operon repressor/biotin-[acetyl-CoA-carboxylase] ligase